MITILYLSLACASISFTVTETKLFEPFRQWLHRHSLFLGKLFSCGFCLGYWTATALTALPAVSGQLPKFFPQGGLWVTADYFFCVLITAWLSGFQWLLMHSLMKKTEN